MLWATACSATGKGTSEKERLQGYIRDQCASKSELNELRDAVKKLAKMVSVMTGSLFSNSS